MTQSAGPESRHATAARETPVVLVRRRILEQGGAYGPATGAIASALQGLGVDWLGVDPFTG